MVIFMKCSRSIASSRGMSLIELLVVISVIGIISALAVPNIASISSQASYAKDARNAQTIAGLLASARAAGATNSWSNVAAAVDDLKVGIFVQSPNGAFEFRISDMSEEDVQGASSNLVVLNGSIQYSSAQ